MDTAIITFELESQCEMIHNDHLGTPQKMTDASGTVVWAADYKPFGEAAITVNAITNNLRFPGQYFDAETGLYYNYYRDYNPVIGRYAEADPIGFSSGDINMYRYVGNQPTNWSDPSGNCPWCLVGFGIGATLNAGQQLYGIYVNNNGQSFNWPQWGFAAASGMLGGGLGTITNGLTFWWNIGANAAGSGVIAYGITSTQNALPSNTCQQQSPWRNAYRSATFSGIGAFGGNLINLGFASSLSNQANLSNIPWNQMTLAQRLIFMNVLRGPYNPANPNAVMGTITGSTYSNLVSNMSQ